MTRRAGIWLFAIVLGVGAVWLVLVQHSDTAHFHHRNIAAHDMDMAAGSGLGGDFAHKSMVVLSPPVPVTPRFRSALADVYREYVELQAALVSGRPDIATRAAQMRRSVERIPVGQLEAKPKQAWRGHRQVLRTSLHQLEGATALSEQRRHFSHVSEALYCAIKSFGGIGSAVRVAYCSMAFNGRGAYWLTSSTRLTNPYMDPKTTECAEVRETI